MQHEVMITTLKALKLFGMARAVDELAGQSAPAYLAAQPVLNDLLKAETAEREVRAIQYQIRLARCPTYRDLTGFDFSQSSVNEALIRQLHRCEFVHDAHNVVLIGGPGTGKTHLATALSMQGIEHHGLRVRFFSTIDLVNALEIEKAAGKTWANR
jgi:DNA replication protein DnaC